MKQSENYLSMFWGMMKKVFARILFSLKNTRKTFFRKVENYFKFLLHAKESFYFHWVKTKCPKKNLGLDLCSWKDFFIFSFVKLTNRFRRIACQTKWIILLPISWIFFFLCEIVLIFFVHIPFFFLVWFFLFNNVKPKTFQENIWVLNIST